MYVVPTLMCIKGREPKPGSLRPVGPISVMPEEGQGSCGNEMDVEMANPDDEIADAEMEDPND
jgi:hypothetical protein